jgi:hypothetical protein
MQELFYQGQYKRILAESVDSPEGRFAPCDLPFVIGALTFRGRLHEAEHLYKLHKASLGDGDHFVTRFFLGVGYCRLSSYARARSLFGENLRSVRRATDPRARFYAWQGIGFYRLFCGRHRSGLAAAQRALEAALEANFLYGKALAADLMGHHQVLPGQVSAALDSFRDAIRYAGLLGDGGLLQAITVSAAIHSAQYGLSPRADLDELRRLCGSIASEDNYSKSRLLLEIGRQLTLRGDTDDARAALNEACQLIYSSKNRRYGILLNLRYAYLMHLAGEPHQALNLVRNAAKELDAEVDRAVAVEVLGLERKIRGSLGMADPGSELDERVERLTAETGRVLSRRILAREAATPPPLDRFGDDPLGDLLDLARLGDHDAAQAIVDRGLFGLLVHLIPGAVGVRMLYFDLIPGSLVVVDRGHVRFHQTGFSSVIRAIAKTLANGEATKQDLIETVWGYRYQSLKHDALIYRNVSRFRALLGRAGHWLEVTESGYRLAGGVEVRFHVPTVVSAQAARSETVPASQPVEGVNFRQLKVLEHLKQTEFVDVHVVTELFQVSEITARRDLARLYELKLVNRLGKGRATRYSLGAMT